MIDKQTMRGLLKDMERAAEEVLQQDSAFFEALQALKWEIEGDSRVQSAVRRLQAAGQKVFSSLVPHIKVRVRTEEGIFALPKPLKTSSIPAAETVAALTQELNNAASAVITTSGHYQQLERIVNEAVTASGRFERLASHIQGAGHEVLISLDLSAYAHVRESSPPGRRLERGSKPDCSGEPSKIDFSANDIKFLKALGIKS
jgi:hypothetical protein